MRLDRSLGDVQIFSDLRVITPLQKQLHDLPFPGTYVAELLFHKHYTLPLRPPRMKLRHGPLGTIWIRVFAYDFAFTRPNRACAVN
jgi:hypothetical protein